MNELKWSYNKTKNTWTGSGEDSLYILKEIKITFDLFDNPRWSILFIPKVGVIGYLSKQTFKIDIYFSYTLINGLNEDCQFSDLEEAKSFCERHYKLQVLQ